MGAREEAWSHLTQVLYVTLIQRRHKSNPCWFQFLQKQILGNGSMPRAYSTMVKIPTRILTQQNLAVIHVVFVVSDKF